MLWLFGKSSILIPVNGVFRDPSIIPWCDTFEKCGITLCLFLIQNSYFTDFPKYLLLINIQRINIHTWTWLWFFCWSQSCWHPSSRLQVNICRNITQSIHWLICVRLCQQLQEQCRLGFYEKLFGEKMLIIFWPHSIIAYWSGKIQSAINPWLLLLTHSIKT